MRAVVAAFNALRLRESGATILLIEQNARAAMAVADHAYVLETGAIALSATGIWQPAIRWM